jgi:signal transduction histidine kinase
MTLSGVVREYWPWIALSALALLFATMTAGYVISLNHRLSTVQLKLQKHQEDLEAMVLERTAQLRSMNDELEQEIADRTRTEAEKTKLQSQLFLIQKMEAVGVLAGGIAHDFNNILTAIIGFGHLILKRVADDPKSMSYAENILLSSTRAAELTQGLLTFSRKQSVDPKPIDLVETVKRTEDLLRELIDEKIDFKMVLSDAKVIVMADSGQIGQVLINLVTNARDAMPDGGVLTIATSVVEPDAEFFKTPPFRKPGPYAALTVTDSGTGMERAIQGKIFEPFFTTKGVGKGTGLGLAIVFGIVEQYDGYLLVDSSLGQGTTFTVYLPIVQAAV